MPSQRKDEDEALVRCFLDRYEDVSPRDVEEKTGISHGTVYRWKRDEWSRLEYRTRRRLKRILGYPPSNEMQGEPKDPGES